MQTAEAKKKARKIMIKRNFAAFNKLLDEQWDSLKKHENEYALIRDEKIVKIFSKPFAALKAGNKLYGDDMFSVQEITREPIELGWYSHAVSKFKS